MKENAISAAGEPVVAPLQAQTNPPHRILVVEDDLAIRRLDTEVLVRSGYEVDAAEDGAAGWDALQAGDYDLMITDNSMPRLTGVELLKKLRAARMELPVIMATGTLPAEEFNRHPWLRPAATLLKPYTVEQLLRTVKKVLRESDYPDISGTGSDSHERKENEPAPAFPPQADPLQAAHRILVVDEDRDLRLMYTEALAGPGYQVDGAADGAAGWAALQTNSYQLLITEHDLPELSGAELVRKVRAAHLALPIVMTASRLPSPELACDPALYLAATLIKPFALEALLHTVESALRATNRPGELLMPAPSPLDRPTSATGWQL